MPPPVELFTTRLTPDCVRRLEHRDRPEHVRDRIRGGILDRAPYVGLSREVEHHLGPYDREQVCERPPIADVEHLQRCPVSQRMLEVLELAGRQVVDDRHSIAPRDQRIYQVRADEPGPARDYAVHDRRELTGPAIGVEPRARVGSLRQLTLH